MKIAVLGAGSWGVALSLLAQRAGNEVVLWGRNPDKMAALSSAQFSPFFPDASLSEISFSSELERSLNGAEVAVCALPCATLPTMAREIVPLLARDSILVCGSKGLHPESGLRASQIWTGAGLSLAQFTALSGPNLAREIVAGAATSSVVASTEPDSAALAQKAFDSALFRVYQNGDLLGVELGGALKNVVAIAAGMGDGRGFGDNAKAALMTRHWREMARLATALGAREETLWGLSGLGDLLATCASAQSRNHRLGLLMGQGKTLDEAQDEIAQTIEGVHTCRAALELGQRCAVFLPVTRALSAILFENLPVDVALAGLMRREGRSDHEGETPKMAL